MFEKIEHVMSFSFIWKRSHRHVSTSCTHNHTTPHFVKSRVWIMQNVFFKLNKTYITFILTLYRLVSIECGTLIAHSIARVVERIELSVFSSLALSRSDVFLFFGLFSFFGTFSFSFRHSSSCFSIFMSLERDWSTQSQLKWLVYPYLTSLAAASFPCSSLWKISFESLSCSLRLTIPFCCVSRCI